MKHNDMQDAQVDDIYIGKRKAIVKNWGLQRK